MNRTQSSESGSPQFVGTGRCCAILHKCQNERCRKGWGRGAGCRGTFVAWEGLSIGGDSELRF